MPREHTHCTFCNLIRGAAEVSICHEDADAIANLLYRNGVNINDSYNFAGVYRTAVQTYLQGQGSPQSLCQLKSALAYVNYSPMADFDDLRCGDIARLPAEGVFQNLAPSLVEYKKQLDAGDKQAMPFVYEMDVHVDWWQRNVSDSSWSQLIQSQCQTYADPAIFAKIDDSKNQAIALLALEQKAAAEKAKLLQMDPLQSSDPAAIVTAQLAAQNPSVLVGGDEYYTRGSLEKIDYSIEKTSKFINKDVPDAIATMKRSVDTCTADFGKDYMKQTVNLK